MKVKLAPMTLTVPKKITVERARCVNADCRHAATSHVLIRRTRNHHDEGGRGTCRYSRCPCVYYRAKEDRN